MEPGTVLRKQKGGLTFVACRLTFGDGLLIMGFNARRLIGCVALVVCGVVPLGAGQRGYLREAVRTERRDINSSMMACGPDIGLEEVVELTHLSIEGVIARTDSALHEDDRGVDE